MAVQRNHRKLQAHAARPNRHTDQLLLHASVLALALLVASIRLIG
jgi:hypothetical protein